MLHRKFREQALQKVVASEMIALNTLQRSKTNNTNTSPATLSLTTTTTMTPPSFNHDVINTSLLNRKSLVVAPSSHPLVVISIHVDNSSGDLWAAAVSGQMLSARAIPSNVAKSTFIDWLFTNYNTDSHTVFLMSAERECETTKKFIDECVDLVPELLLFPSAIDNASLVFSRHSKSIAYGENFLPKDVASGLHLMKIPSCNHPALDAARFVQALWRRLSLQMSDDSSASLVSNVLSSGIHIGVLHVVQTGPKQYSGEIFFPSGRPRIQVSESVQDRVMWKLRDALMPDGHDHGSLVCLVPGGRGDLRLAMTMAERTEHCFVLSPIDVGLRWSLGMKQSEDIWHRWVQELHHKPETKVRTSEDLSIRCLSKIVAAGFPGGKFSVTESDMRHSYLRPAPQPEPVTEWDHIAFDRKRVEREERIMNEVVRCMSTVDVKSKRNVLSWSRVPSDETTCIVGYNLASVFEDVPEASFSLFSNAENKEMVPNKWIWCILYAEHFLSGKEASSTLDSLGGLTRKYLSPDQWKLSEFQRTEAIAKAQMKLGVQERCLSSMLTFMKSILLADECVRNGVHVDSASVTSLQQELSARSLSFQRQLTSHLPEDVKTWFDWTSIDHVKAYFKSGSIAVPNLISSSKADKLSRDLVTAAETQSVEQKFRFISAAAWSTTEVSLYDVERQVHVQEKDLDTSLVWVVVSMKSYLTEQVLKLTNHKIFNGANVLYADGGKVLNVFHKLAPENPKWLSPQEESKGLGTLLRSCGDQGIASALVQCVRTRTNPFRQHWRTSGRVILPGIVPVDILRTNDSTNDSIETSLPLWVHRGVKVAALYTEFRRTYKCLGSLFDPLKPIFPIAAQTNDDSVVKVNVEYKTMSSRSGHIRSTGNVSQEIFAPGAHVSLLKSKHGSQGSIVTFQYDHLDYICLALLSRDPILLKDVTDGIDLYCRNVSLLCPEVTYTDAVALCKGNFKEQNFVHLRHRLKHLNQITTNSAATFFTKKEISTLLLSEKTRYAGVRTFLDVECSTYLKRFRPDIQDSPTTVPRHNATWPYRSQGIIFTGNRFNVDNGSSTPLLARNLPIQALASEIVTHAYSKVLLHLKHGSELRDSACIVGVTPDSLILDVKNSQYDTVTTDVVKVMRQCADYIGTSYPEISLSGNIDFNVLASNLEDNKF